MSSNSKIEWTQTTWNPVTGCTKISLGCDNCYAERMAKRLQTMGQRNYQNGFKVTTHNHALELPLRWKRPRLVFVNSMSDMFHEDVPDEFIFQIYNTMKQTPQHCYQILTKRSERMLNLSKKLPVLRNVWHGVTVETKDYLYRVDHLRETTSFVRFLSLEPLLGPIIKLDLSHIDWVILGGESGPNARFMAKEWVKNIRDICVNENVPFFFKQWGGVQKSKNGRKLDGDIWEEMPRKNSLYSFV